MSFRRNLPKIQLESWADSYGMTFKMGLRLELFLIARIAANKSNKLKKK